MSFTVDEIRETIAEAERFIEKATGLLSLMKSTPDREYATDYPRESGAMRRASLDLWRKLAELRRPYGR